LTLACGTSLAGTTHVAVAANFTAPMKDIAAQFEEATGHKVVLSFGSTGKLFAQIRHGAPFQLMLAADQATPEKIETDKLGVPGTRFTYAVGALALWSAQAHVVDDQGKVLQTPGITRLALADPKLAPYGRAAIETLQHMGRLEALKPALILGENIAQAYQFTATGNAPLGFVALSQIMQDGKISRGSAWVVPTAYYSPIRQDAIVLNAGQDDEATLALVKFLRSEPALAIMNRYGYGH
jgi:molybdate transport system substrate-binding protein